MVYVLFLMLVAAMRALDPHAATATAVVRDVGAASGAAPAVRVDDAALVALVTAADVPEAALRALRERRFFRAAQLLREHMQTTGDSAPATVLLAARAANGWGDWQSTERLLAGRPWLDAHALGWALLGHARLSLESWEPARAALSRALAAVDLDGREAALARVRLGQALARAGDERGAAAAYADAATALPAIGGWLRLEALLATGRAGDSVAVARLLGALEPELAREWGWQALVDARLQTGDTAGAVTAAESAAPAMAGAARRADAWRQAGSLRAARRDAAGARAAFRESIAAAAGSGAARSAARALADLTPLAAEDQLLVARTLIRHGDVQRGGALLRGYIDAGHGTAATREALRLELGTALFNGRQYDDAERVLLELARTTSQRARAAEAMFVAARSQYRGGRTSQGRATFERVGREYAGEAAAVRALYFAADLLHDDAELGRAERLYRQAVDSGRGDVEEVGLAAMRLGGLAWVRGDHAAALQEYSAYLRRFPQGRAAAQATYWAGRASAALGDEAGARRYMAQVRASDAIGYYGALASDYLGEPFPALRLATGPTPTRRDEIERALHGVDLLVEIGWNSAASFEVDRLRARHAGEDAVLYTLAEALNERGMTSAGVAIGWELHRRGGGYNDRLIRIVYPFPFRELVLAEARARAVDPFLAAGLIRQESLFNATALSPAGAVGLMQVMPETGRALAGSLGIARFTPDMLRNPEVNTYLGMAYLADQIRSYGERTDAVLAAYNAGPHRVQRWREFPEWRDRALFADRIPFAETRGYVKIVESNARLYRYLYGVERS